MNKLTPPKDWRYTFDGIEVADGLNSLAIKVHKANENWWRDPKTHQSIARNVGEMLMLCVTELAEAMEGHRRDLMDDHIPTRRMFEVELADCLIRLFDIAAGLHLDIGGAFVEKMGYNAIRHDHTDDGRLQIGGKKY